MYMLQFSARGETNNLIRDKLFFVSQFFLKKIMFVGEKQILTIWSSGNASRSVDSKKVLTCVDVEGPAYQYQKKKHLTFAKN